MRALFDTDELPLFAGMSLPVAPRPRRLRRLPGPQGRPVRLALLAWAGLAAPPPRRRFKSPPPPQSAIWPERDASFDNAVAAFARALRPTIKRPRVDPIVEAISECAGVIRAVGKPVFEDPTAHAWLEIDRDAPIPTVRIWSRGVQIGGPEFDDARQTLRTVARRDFSFDAVRDALSAARVALHNAGFALAAYHEARLVDPEHGIGCAIIGLRSTTPARFPQIAHAPATMAA